MVDSSGEVTDLKNPVLGRGGRMLWGAGIGAAANVASGAIQGQWRDPWKLAADAGIGAVTGAAGGYLGPDNGLGPNVAAGVITGAASGAADQLVQNGGASGFRLGAVGLDGLLGGVPPGLGPVADHFGISNKGQTVGGDMLGGIGGLACAAFSGGIC